MALHTDEKPLCGIRTALMFMQRSCILVLCGCDEIRLLHQGFLSDNSGGYSEVIRAAQPKDIGGDRELRQYLIERARAGELS